MVTSVSWSPDSKILATASSDSTLKLWNVATGQELKTLIGHQGAVFSVSFSPNGKTLASGSIDSTLKLWDVATGKELKTLLGHQSLVTSVSWSPDGKTLATGSNDNTVKLWNLDFENLMQLGCSWVHTYLLTHPHSLELDRACNVPPFTTTDTKLQPTPAPPPSSL